MNRFPTIPVPPEDTDLRLVCLAHCGVANPRDTTGYRCGLRLALHPGRLTLNIGIFR